ncbi:hypothetical protein [Bdellovibrio reynosensis]|uniref:Uncharacterized protein n=1 Tax=Bdellovibrio reynosensis TaxID=2835041 RepID=A0ABY4CBT8_9BACT|nr:hypothetical protein [Bdellovibrio reynosensis]UOF01352.1 hypothetical protein MNR06_00090 [Bdellovibrio reynosensis]
MKLNLSKKAAMLSLASLLAAAPAPAVVCLAPHPVCGVVIIGGLVVSIIAARDAAKKGNNLDPIAVEQNQAKLRTISKKLEGTNYALRMKEHANYSQGYSAVVSRYQKGKIYGRLSLTSLMKFSPQLFADLDKMEEMLAYEYGKEVTTQVYGTKYNTDGSINWKRYSLLAQDSLAIYSNSWKD